MAPSPIAEDEYEENQSFREQQRFDSLETSLSLKLYDRELETIRRTRVQGTGYWLENEIAFRNWSDTSSRSAPVLWLSGIPGAGKRHP